MVRGDPVRLSQVLDNLLDNAASHAGEGAEVRVSLRGGPTCTLEVSDTGRGIPEEHMPFLFDPFYRVDTSRSPSGRHAGLGLRICRGLIEAHGGTLELRSEVGAGTTVTIELPAASQQLDC
jgi:signal transduction histidine kinase